MPKLQDTERHLAMLIDGDNAQHALLQQMFEEANRYGDVTIRRAYGDWTQINMSGWRDAMLAHAIQPIQQFRYTIGKNATDSALIIDAMDILYSGTVQGFCIVSSDSDYTRLCTRIRESGMFVMGIGRQQTPAAFTNACNIFVHVENLVESDAAKVSAEIEAPAPVKAPAPAVVKTPAKAKTSALVQIPAKGKTPVVVQTPAKKAQAAVVVKAPAKPKTAAPAKPPTKALLNLLNRAFDIAIADDEGWVHLGPLGSALQRLEPSFDSRTYGFKTLWLLMNSMPKHVAVKGDKKSGTSTIYARMKTDV